MDNVRKAEYDDTYMKMACSLKELSYAKRNQVGCLVVSDNGQIIAQGYNGMPTGYPNGCEDQVWNPDNNNYELVTKPEVLHAESNAISKCAKYNVSSNNATAYVTLSPCLQCSKILVQSGIKRVVFLDEYRDLSPLGMLIATGIIVDKIDLLHKKIYRYYIDENGETMSYECCSYKR